MAEEKFIRIENNKILKSNDNFKTFEEVKSIDGYEVLKKRNQITELSLRYFHGNKKAAILIREFKKINQLIFDEPQKHDDGYGRAFEVFAIAIYYDLTYEQVIEENIIGGSDDGKIDAIIVNNDTVFIYQIKMNTVADVADIEKAKENYLEYAETKKISSSNSADLKKFLDKNFHKYEDKFVKVFTISNGKAAANNICSKDLFDKFFVTRLLPQNNSNIVLKIKIDRAKDETTGQKVYNYART